MTLTALARLPRALCAAVLAFTSELVPAPELPLHDFDFAGLEPSHADFDDETVCGADGGPEYWVSPSHNCYCQKPRGHEEGTDHECWCLAVWRNPPSAAAVPPAAVCCSEGGVTPGVVPPSEPPTTLVDDSLMDHLRNALLDVLAGHRATKYYGSIECVDWDRNPCGSHNRFRDHYEYREHVGNVFVAECQNIRFDRMFTHYEHSPAYFDTDRNK